MVVSLFISFIVVWKILKIISKEGPKLSTFSDVNVYLSRGAADVSVFLLNSKLTFKPRFIYNLQDILHAQTFTLPRFFFLISLSETLFISHPVMQQLHVKCYKRLIIFTLVVCFVTFNN